MKVRFFPIQKLLVASVLLVRGTFGILIKYPSNAAIDVGSSTTFTCASDVDHVSWIKTLDGKHTEYPREELTDASCNVYPQYADHFSTEGADTRSCNLTLFNALISHGGFYTCVQSAFASSFYSHSVLIVIDNEEAVIQSNKSEEIVDGEFLYMGNTIGYGGPWPKSNGQLVLPPAFKWTLQSNPNNTLPSSNAATWNMSSSYYTITAQQPTVPAYVSSLFFNNISVPSYCATNLPTYTRSWTFPQSFVYYMNRPSIQQTQYIEPIGGCVARILRCIPDAYPPPSVQWTDMKTMEVFDSDNITAELNGTYKCTTRNTIRGEQRNDSTTYTVAFNSCPRAPCIPESNVPSVTLSNGTESSVSIGLGVALGVSVLINIVLGVLLFVSYHLRHKPASSRGGSSAAQYEQTNVQATDPQPSDCYYEELSGEHPYANTSEQRYQKPIKLNRRY